jgi:hypothetical protein
MQDQDDVPNLQGFDKGFEVPDVILDPVWQIRLVRATHTDQIGSDASRMRRNMRNDIAPEIRGCRIAVLKQHDGTLADVDVGHMRAENLNALHHG